MERSLGDRIPAGDVHGVSVQLPSWQDNIGWASRDPQVLAHMKTGYPRFFIHRSIEDLANRLVTYILTVEGSEGISSGKDAEDREEDSASFRKGQLAILFPSLQSSFRCRHFLSRAAPRSDLGQILVRAFDINGLNTINFTTQGYNDDCSKPVAIDWQKGDLVAVIYPASLYPKAKAFWQHTGSGISSRYAAWFLDRQRFLPEKCGSISPSLIEPFTLNEDNKCKHVLRGRIAESAFSAAQPVGPEHVFLYPSGMTGISEIAAALTSSHQGRSGPIKVVIFGFLYVDTFKVLNDVYGFESVLYGHASSSELDELESQLSSGKLSIDALVAEFPGNPLLIIPDLKRLHKLSLKHNFWLIVDDTIGTFANVSLLAYCDIICTSLTKMFSGACNVMGGSVTLNPSSPFFSSIYTNLKASFIDAYFPPDATLMELNSRDFIARVHAASSNAETVVSTLRAHHVVSHVYYPQSSPSQHLYDAFKLPDGRYGFLLSVTFVSPECAIAFHDALDVDKGPSLGTNFTLACAYTLLGHYRELEWAAQFGVVEHLVRISVGLEEKGWLVEVVKRALDAAEAVAVAGKGIESL